MAVSSVLSSAQITSLIQQASAAYQAPAKALQAQEKPIEAQISALNKVESALSSLQSALGSLADISTLAQRSVTESPDGAVTASVTNAATPGTYSLSGIHLAQSQRLISSGSASASGTLGSGSIAIQVGGGSATTIAVTSGQSSLDAIATAINQASAGVTASVVYDGASYHLVLSGNATGAANAFTVSGSGALSGLSYSSGTSGGLSQATAAADAGFTLNGIAITSGSNTITGVVNGLTLTLAASGSATVTVASDVSALDKAANSVVTALNGVLSTIDQFASYSPASGGGPLFGDIGVQVLRSGLLNAIASPFSAGAPGTPYNSLGAVGFGITSGGTVTFDDAKFQSAAAANYGAVASLLGGTAVASNPAIAVQGVGAAQPGTYPINIASNTNGAVSGSINGEPASGSGGVLVVTGTGAAHGLALAIPPGLSGALGTVTVGEGLYGSLGAIVGSGAGASGNGVTSEISSLNDRLTSMNQQVARLQQQAQQQTQLLSQQYSDTISTMSQLSMVSNFLTTYFNLPSGGLGG